MSAQKRMRAEQNREVCIGRPSVDSRIDQNVSNPIWLSLFGLWARPSLVNEKKIHDIILQGE